MVIDAVFKITREEGSANGVNLHVGGYLAGVSGVNAYVRVVGFLGQIFARNNVYRVAELAEYG